MEEPKPDIGSGAGAKNKGSKPQFRSFKKHGNTNVNFDGHITTLKGHIYNCSGPSQADQYTTTTHEIAGYVTTTFKNGNDVKTAIEKMSVPSIKLPANLPTTATQAEKRRWEKKVDEGTKRELQLEDDMKTLYSVLWGQCSKALKHRIQATKVYAAMHEDADSLSLLKELHSQAFNFQSQKDQAQVLQEAIR